MSLFKTKEWWRTRCGADETFDRHSLLAVPLFGEEKKDILIVGSHDGYLRMYSPSSQWLEETKSPTNYKSTDLMIETRIGDCIVDIQAGKFVSGTQDLRLAVLTSSKLLVYNAVLVEESTEYGDRCELRLVYEHTLAKFPASLTIGAFGGVRGRDFLCVQSLDGTLLFYEQEVFAFSQVLRNRLLAQPIVYQSMAENTRRKEERGEQRRPSGTTLEPDWSFNIGEAVLDIEAVTLSSFEVGILVLGERHLYCFKDNCATVKYAKRLEYRPLCFRPYVIEPDGKLMVLVIADTGTLMIYEGSTVKWSAQLPFAPVTVARVQLQHLQGVIVVLSEDGRLEACYLGSEPSMFVAPPLHPRGYDYATAEQELAVLRTLLRKSRDSENQINDAGMDAELTVSVNVSPEMKSRVHSGGERYSEEESETMQQLTCTVAIHLSSYATLRDLEVCVDVSRPLAATNTYYALPILCERHVAVTDVYVDDDSPAISSEILVTVTYRTDAGNLRAVRRTGRLPLKMMLRTSPPENAATFANVIKCGDSLLGFVQLFPEFSTDECRRQGWNALGLRHSYSGQTVTVVSGNASNRYRVQSNDGLSSTLVVERLLERLREKSKGSLASSIGQNQQQLVHHRIERHFHARREIERITAEIRLLTGQLRNVERKMLRAARERNERSLADTGLPFLFELTYRAIFALLEQLTKARAERERAAHELRCSLRLLLLLLRLNVTDEKKYALLEAAIGFAPRSSDRIDWEEIADATLSTLLRSVSRKPTVSETRSSTTWNALAPISSGKELSKLKKRLVHAIERLDGSRELDIAEIESTDGHDIAPP
ncbi:Protein PTHB1 [Anthophora quadrimaculata]